VAAGVRQVIYLGGLGDDRDDLSPHLQSRHEVERILCSEAPTTALRAEIVIGDGGISWEILRQLVARLPVMITPRWVQTRTDQAAWDEFWSWIYAIGFERIAAPRCTSRQDLPRVRTSVSEDADTNPEYNAIPGKHGSPLHVRHHGLHYSRDYSRNSSRRRWNGHCHGQVRAATSGCAATRKRRCGQSRRLRT
jgi:hypothetical protein